MDIFDLHCDTAYECRCRGLGLDNCQTAVRLSSLTGRRVQCFAAFVPDSLRGEAAYTHYGGIRDWLHGQQSERLRLYNEQIDLFDGCTAVLTVESGAALGGKPERVFDMHRDGVKMIGLTWNGDNELACGCLGSGGGLSEVGRTAVDNMRRCGIIIDVSHLNGRGFNELADMGCTLVASHSCLDSVHSHPRNLTDRQFGYIRDCGGLVGINFYRDFLGYGGDADALYRHVNRALELGGEEVLAIGSDYDGAEISEPLAAADCFERLADYLSGRGLADGIINKMFSGNALRFFARGRRMLNEVQQHTQQRP